MKKSDALAKALAEALAEEERTREKFGDDQEDGAVIAFKVRFSKRGVNYDHAALRSGGLWYTTGPRSPKGFTWSELTEWLDPAHHVSKITVLREGKAKKDAKLQVALAPSSHTCPDVESDERVQAWDGIAKHPFFAGCYSTDGTLMDAMVAKLDAAHECSAVPVERLSAAVRRVRELHRESNGSLSALYPNPICECGKDYPCQTARALGAEDPQVTNRNTT